MMSRTEIERLARAANALRPDWPIGSLETFIRQQLSPRAYRDVAVALAFVAVDPYTQTPARVLEAGPWWNATTAQPATVSTISMRCPQHPDRTAWKCPDCRDEAVTDPDELERLRALVRGVARGDREEATSWALRDCPS